MKTITEEIDAHVKASNPEGNEAETDEDMWKYVNFFPEVVPYQFDYDSCKWGSLWRNM